MSKVNTIRNIVHRNIERQLVREYLLKETERAGFGGLEFNRTPDGTKVTLSADCLLYTSPSPRDGLLSRMPSSA